MLFERQRLLLTLLDALDGPVAPTDFQKLLFLYTREQESPSYEFVPYQMGCFSFSTYADKRKLIEKSLLAGETEEWRLTEEGRAIARKRAVKPLLASRFSRDHAGLRGNALIAEVYRRYPYYATRSRIVDKVLESEEDRQRVLAERPRPGAAGLMTIGYEGKCLESYLNQLLKAGVTLLCDVRRNPLSRKYGFSRSTLRVACEKVEIRYEHLPELGIASENRRALTTQADYDALFAGYERESLPQQHAALAKIRNWIGGGECVALTCFELHPHQCHRHCVAKALEQGSGGRLQVLHL